MTSEWLKNLVVSVGLLGIRVSTNDLAAVGSASLIVVMVWFFFSQRRENRAIVGLLRDYTDKLKKGETTKAVCWMVYQGIVQNIVFIDMGGGDKPLKGVFRENEGTGSGDTPVTRSLEESHQNQGMGGGDRAPKVSLRQNEQKQRRSFVRLLLSGLVFLPPFTILMILISDVSSLLASSYLRVPQQALWKILLSGSRYFDLGKIVAFDAFAIASCGYTLHLCIICRAFSSATADTIKEFSPLLKREQSPSEVTLASEIQES